MRKFHPSNVRRRMPRKNNDQVSLYCEETNAETNAGLVMRIYRIVPQMHSAVLSTLYMCKKTAIEILLRKHESCLPNAWKTFTRRCGDFQTNLWTYSLWLSTSYIINVCPCICFCKDNHSWRQELSSPEVNDETRSEKKGNLVSEKVNNRNILLLFRQKWLSL